MNGECRMKIQIFNRLIRHGESFRAPRSVQESIPVRKIYRDGVWLCGGRYSKMWRFQDVNYAVASEADQAEILMRYCSVINAWPDDAYVQVLTNNRRIDPVEFENTMLMHLRGDDMDRLREEYNQIVRERTEWSNNIFREKYIVISVQRRSIEEARSFFARVGTELASGFGRLSSQLTELSSHDRIRILHDFFRSGEEQYFNFDLSQAMARGQDFRDYIAPDSTQHVNALELGKGYEAGEKPVSLKSEFILTLYEHLLDVQTNGRRAKSIIDRAVLDLYEEFSKKPQAPTLQDLYRILQCQKENLAKDIVLASEIFTKGSLNTFAQPTNVQLDNRVLCFNIRDLGQQLRPIGMLVLMEVVMMRVMQNRLRGKRTWIYFDELSVLFSYEWSTNFLDVSWKRYRKYGALASGIFQNLDQALDNEVAHSMISNSEFLVLLNQAASDRTKLAELLHISDTQLSYVTDSEAGRGLLKMGGSLVPFINDIPKDTQLYKLMSTRPGEV